MLHPSPIVAAVRVALVSREVHPFVRGGGLGRYVAATAETLAPLGEVTVFTSTTHEPLYHTLIGDQSRELPAEVRFVFVEEPEPDEIGSFLHHMHAWGGRVLEALKREYGSDGPDIVEFPDYLGEGCVTVQARRTLDPTFRDSCVCVRCYTPSEMTSVLNGNLPKDFATRVLFDLERLALQYADRILSPGGDVYPSFVRFYSDRELAPGFEIPHAVPEGGAPAGSESKPRTGPLRLLYLGRLERRKGVQNLIRAVTALERDDWHLTLVGGDTETAPLRTSMRDQLQLMAANDRRIEFRAWVPSSEIAPLMRAHDLLVVPSLWECWPNVALEALSQNRPLLASPVGGLLGMVERGKSGWLTRRVGEADLIEKLEELIANPEQARELSESGLPRGEFERLTDPDAVRERYVEMLASHREANGRRLPPRVPDPLVSVVIPYFELDEHVEETLQSIFAQTHENIEVIIVNDGSFRPEDALLDELADRYPIEVVTQQNSGLSAARNYGISQARGRYVLPMDADDLLAPTFVGRCVEILQHDRDVSYVTSWSHFIDEDGVVLSEKIGGYRPLGNGTGAVDELNVAGSAEAVFDRRVFDLGIGYSVDLTSYEDWLHFRELKAQGFVGHVIPEPLLFYRIRPTSMVRTLTIHEHDRLIEEMQAHLREREVTWTPKSG
jgi:glycogen(starch) synthase